MTPLIFISVFIATLVTDALWALYLAKVTEKSPLLAASYGSLIHLLGAFTVLSYTQNSFYLIPLILGSFVGTYTIVFFSKKETK
jgi:uncharacterized membrane protein